MIINSIRGFLAALLLLPATLAAQINPDDLLPVEQAFALSAERVQNDRAIELRWQVADGYYMYRHAFRFEPASEGLVLGEPRIDPGRAYTDEFFGDVEIYRGQARVVVPILEQPAEGPLAITVGFQGCADLGVCYPPHRQQIELARSAQATAPSATAPTAAPRNGDLSSRLGISSGAGALTGRSEPLPAEQAFGVEVIALDERRLLARMTAHPDYYLYRHAIEFISETPPISVADAELPVAREITDEFFGQTQVYYDEVEIPIRLERPAGPATDLALTVKFQGCQTDGICYPPMQRQINVDLPAAGTAVDEINGGVPASAAGDAAGPPESDQDRLARLIEEQSLFVTMLLFVLLGIGLAFTPCVFPMIPILSGIIAGEGENITRAKAFSLSLAYVLAMALTYTTVGVIAALAGYNLQAMFQNPWVLSVFAAIFVALSLAMFGFYNLQMPASLQAKLTEISNRQSGGSLAGAGIMGFLSAIIVGPCVTAPLIGILIFISQTGDAVLGGSVLFALSIGMGIPLLAIGVGLGHWLPRAGGWMESVKAVFGVGLLALAIWMLERVLPGGVTMILWGALAVASGVYLGALSRLDDTVSGWRKLWQALGVMLLVFGILQFVGAAAGGRDWLRPLEPFAGGTASGTTVAQPTFATVSNLTEIERYVDAARQPVFLDFYADWCVDCKRMERRTFPEPAVAEEMQRFDLVKIDMTDFNSEHQQVLNHFGLHGPPAYLFFAGGAELDRYRMFGFMAPDDFVSHLERVRQAAQ
ncbi:MAG: protein-disulfide reductase DsbD [Wenzhouxiangellaceae bacterium]